MSPMAPLPASVVGSAAEKTFATIKRKSGRLKRTDANEYRVYLIKSMRVSRVWPQRRSGSPGRAQAICDLFHVTRGAIDDGLIEIIL